jgi:hypothetical protein
MLVKVILGIPIKFEHLFDTTEQLLSGMSNSCCVEDRNKKKKYCSNCGNRNNYTYKYEATQGFKNMLKDINFTLSNRLHAKDIILECGEFILPINSLNDNVTFDTKSYVVGKLIDVLDCDDLPSQTITVGELSLYKNSIIGMACWLGLSEQHKDLEDIIKLFLVVSETTKY